MEKKHFDAIIVGSGLNGSWAAKELTENGLNVALIDAGNKLEKDFFINKWKKNEYFDPYKYFLILKSFLSNKQTKNTALLYRANKKIYVKEDENPYISLGTPFNWHRSRIIGGKGHVWGRVSPRYTDNEFNSNNDNNIGFEWPINLTKLSNYYDQVENLLELGWNKNHSDRMPKANIIKERKLNHLEEKFAKITEKKWSKRIVDVKPVMEYEPGSLSPMLDIAIKTNKLTLYENCIVRKINTDFDGLAKGVEIINTKSKKIYNLSSDVIVISASPFESVRLLLSSFCLKHPNGLGNSSGLLGKYILEHIPSEYFGFLPNELLSKKNINDLNPFKPNKDPHGFYIAPFKEKNDFKNNFRGKFQIQGSISLKQKSIYLLAFGETIPSKNNFLKIDINNKDKWGLPICKINFNWSQNDIEMWKYQNKILEELVNNFEKEMNIKFDRRDKMNKPLLGTAHESGGARMGSDPKNSVVNEYCRLWDSPNVLVCDASNFPSIGYQNPANTSMAITIRACKNISKIAKNKIDLKKI